jgi:hypothetical protein
MSQISTEQERLFDLERLVPLCEAIRKGSEYETALGQATSEVNSAQSVPDRLKALESAVSMLVGTSYLPTAELEVELTTLTKTGKVLETSVDAQALKDARFSVKEVRQSVERAEGIVAKAWAAQIRADFTPLKRLGEVLAEITDTKASGIELRTWAGQILDLCGNGPPPPESLAKFDVAKAELPRRLDRLGKLGIDANVRDFLLEVAGKGATLKNLTPQVLAWLHDKHAGSRFKIELL